MASTVDDGGGAGDTPAAKMSTTERVIKSQYFALPFSFGGFALCVHLPVEFCPNPLHIFRQGRPSPLSTCIQDLAFFGTQLVRYSKFYGNCHSEGV